MPTIKAAASCFPPYYYSQAELASAMMRAWPMSESRIKRLTQFLENVKVSGRYLSQPIEAYEKDSDFEGRNNVWIRTALDLGEQALSEVLQEASVKPEDLNALAFTTVTGLSVPSIEARLMNRIPINRNVKRMPFFGYGCLGGAAGLARLSDYLAGHPKDVGILLSIELCSLTIQKDDLSVANLISSALFGDGGAAVLAVGDEHPLAQTGGPRILGSKSIFFPASEGIMGWDVRNTGFKIVLSADVTDVALGLKPHMDAFLQEYDLTIPEIDHWMAHPGGPKVIQALETGLDLPEDALQLSWDTLEEAGNMSSASVLHILDRTLKSDQVKPGDTGVLMAMGPGFSAELVLMQW